MVPRKGVDIEGMHSLEDRLREERVSFLGERWDDTPVAVSNAVGETEQAVAALLEDEEVAASTTSEENPGNRHSEI